MRFPENGGSPALWLASTYIPSEDRTDWFCIIRSVPHVFPVARLTLYPTVPDVPSLSEIDVLERLTAEVP